MPFEHLVGNGLGLGELVEIAGQRAVLVTSERERRRPLDVQVGGTCGAGQRVELAFEALELELVVGRLGRSGYQGSARYGNSSRKGLSFSSGFGGVFGSIGAWSQSDWRPSVSRL